MAVPDPNKKPVFALPKPDFGQFNPNIAAAQTTVPDPNAGGMWANNAPTPTTPDESQRYGYMSSDQPAAAPAIDMSKVDFSPWRDAPGPIGPGTQYTVTPTAPVPNPNPVTVPKTNPVTVPKTPVSTASTIPSTVTQPSALAQTSGMSAQYQDWQTKQRELLAKYESLMNTDFQYDPETDPRYKAFRELTNSRAADAAGEATKGALETMNDRGILNSTVTSNQLGQIENKSRQQAETEALAQVPQFYSEARGAYQDKLRNASELLNFATGRGDKAYQNAYQQERDTRGDQVVDRAFDYDVSQDLKTDATNAEKTTYDRAQSAEKTAYDREQAAAKTVYDKEQDALKTAEEKKKDHIDLANYLSKEYNVHVYPTEDPMESYAQVAGIPTAAAQKIAADAKQTDFENAIKKALADNTINTSQATIALEAERNAQTFTINKRNAATSEQNANTSKQNADNTATRYKDEQEAKGNATAYESDIMGGLSRFQSSEQAIGWLRENAKEISANLGSAKYDDMLKMLPTFYGEGKDNSGAVRQKAVEAAMKDTVNWAKAKTADQREKLIQEYMTYYK